MWPKELLPTHTLPLALDAGDVHVAVCRPRLTPWTGSVEGVHRYGRKPLIEVDGRPQFAEVAILRLFKQAGWQARWVQARRTPTYWVEWDPRGPRYQRHVPVADAWAERKLQAIVAANGNTHAGCWDVVAWKDERLVFAESKQRRHDRMRDTQVRWLEAALRSGCSVEDFMLVEWELA